MNIQSELMRLNSDLNLQQVLAGDDPDQRLFAAIAFLCREEEKLERQHGKSRIPFHRIMIRYSSHYRLIFRLGRQFKIKSLRTKKSVLRGLHDFSATEGTYSVPDFIKEEIHWYASQKYSPRVISELKRVLSFNFGSYHDLLHMVLYQLIFAPPTVLSSDYFILIEAMVQIQDFYIVKELGLPISRALRAAGTTYRAFDAIDDRQWQKNQEQSFLQHFLGHLGTLRGWSVDQMKKRFPKELPYRQPRMQYFSHEFVHETSLPWLSRQGKFVLKTFRRQKKWELAFKLPDPSLEHFIRNPESRKAIWDFQRRLFLTKTSRD